MSRHRSSQCISSVEPILSSVLDVNRSTLPGAGCRSLATGRLDAIDFQDAGAAALVAQLEPVNGTGAGRSSVGSSRGSNVTLLGSRQEALGTEVKSWGSRGGKVMVTEQVDLKHSDRVDVHVDRHVGDGVEDGLWQH